MFAIDDGQHDSQEFRERVSTLPFLGGDRAESLPPRTLCLSQVNATMKYISSTHAFLDSFIGMDMKTLRSVPVTTYARAGFAVVGLFKNSI
jgi:hypothetical protein